MGDEEKEKGRGKKGEKRLFFATEGGERRKKKGRFFFPSLRIFPERRFNNPWAVNRTREEKKKKRGNSFVSSSCLDARRVHRGGKKKKKGFGVYLADLFHPPPQGLRFPREGRGGKGEKREKRRKTNSSVADPPLRCAMKSEITNW